MVLRVFRKKYTNKSVIIKKLTLIEKKKCNILADNDIRNFNIRIETIFFYESRIVFVFLIFSLKSK